MLENREEDQMTTDRSTITFSPLSASSRSSPHYTRYSILPCYPTLNIENHAHLLLTNVPIHHLNEDELERRSTYGYHQPSAIAPVNDHERQIFFLSRLWNIDKDILEFNFKRLKSLTQRLAIYRMQHFKTSRNEEYLHEDDYAMALEFFLQFDLNLFYMKTCSYRDVEPIRDIPKGLFSGHHEPQAPYAMTPCQQLSCCLCYPSYKLTYRHQYQPIIRFESNQEHHFINGYRSILNCPASCISRNLIYVLTCPCQRVDYIGETSLSLADRLTYHQAHGNRILQEFLLGKKNIERIRNKLKSFETLVKDNMKLYKHSAHCSSAIQWFLDENPEYWPFVPEKITDTEVQAEENEIINSINDVPTPPNGYRYSREQKRAIDRFFHEEKYLHTPNPHLDLYYASIIALLPSNASDVLRRWVEALFITQTETKLNSTGHLDQMISSTDNMNEISSMDDAQWCQNLVRRPHSYD